MLAARLDGAAGNACLWRRSFAAAQAGVRYRDMALVCGDFPRYEPVFAPGFGPGTGFPTTLPDLRIFF